MTPDPDAEWLRYEANEFRAGSSDSGYKAATRLHAIATRLESDAAEIERLQGKDRQLLEWYESVCNALAAEDKEKFTRSSK